MCVLIDQDVREFEVAIGQLAAFAPEKRTWQVEGDPAYAIRLKICERSRFVYISAVNAAHQYEGVLENLGADAQIRAAQIRALFKEAVDLLSCQIDDSYHKVKERQEELDPILVRALGAGVAP